MVHRYLKQADLAQCAQRRKFMQRIRNLEASVAQQMGVSMLYTNSKLQVQPQYTHLLERLANEATTRGTLRSVVACSTMTLQSREQL